MPGVPTELAEHHLHVRPEAKPVKQPLRRFAEERRMAIGEEIARLLAAGFIMEVLHPDWLANPVLVLKKNGSWRMCIDYTSLNKACPKDPFPLPRIDQVIDSTAGCELLSFLDAYSGYHQIPLNPADQIKTSFITPREINHIATGTAPSLDGELLPLHGSSSGDEDGGGDGAVSMEKPSGGTSPSRQGAGRDSCPPDLGFAMTAALELFSYRGFLR
ncbi:hypothetical protein QYE76_018724 [Lolium multiflorum]|uniref:Reverse transcriptase domain-containing protein n=1 Tax=Lolium multiflorum TaxID=4521 RepID=A0AAD8QCR0_LOLMU|nr:hypothetical protein QYE76_018724 [Lolium multiflorum]